MSYAYRVGQSYGRVSPNGQAVEHIISIINIVSVRLSMPVCLYGGTVYTCMFIGMIELLLLNYSVIICNLLHINLGL